MHASKPNEMQTPSRKRDSMGSPRNIANPRMGSRMDLSPIQLEEEDRLGISSEDMKISDEGGRNTMNQTIMS